MSNIEEKLKPLEGYFLTLKRNIVEGWYELEVGLPSKWIFKGNKNIECDVTKTSSAGKLVTIKPKKKNITSDDLIEFVELIIQTNEEIANREKSFTERMDKVKKNLEDEVNKFYKELEDLREKSFTNFDHKSKKIGLSEVDSDKKDKPVEGAEPRKRRGRPPGSKTKTSVKKENVEAKTE